MITFTDNILDSPFIERVNNYKKQIKELSNIGVVTDGSFYKLVDEIIKNGS